MASDPFENILNLEEQFYQEGYKQGVDDGAQAGKIEGRAFGLEKGFEKFVESGRLNGKAIVWANRLPKNRKAQDGTSQVQGQAVDEAEKAPVLPPLPANARLEKNINTLAALVEPESLSTENNDEAVQDFDDRLKRAQGKAKIIERMLGEVSAKGASSGNEHASQAKTGNIEDANHIGLPAEASGSAS